jgi:hypothetical protein
MKKDDLRLDAKNENRARRLKRASSLFISSNSLEIEDSIAESAEQNEVSDIGNQAPKRRHKSMPLSFIATNEEGKEMPSIELTPSASLNLGANFAYEAESANNTIINDSCEPPTECPTECVCTGTVVDCKGKNLFEIPMNLPEITTEM